MENIVCLTRVSGFTEEGIKDAVYRALDMIGFKRFGSAKSVVIKPNLCYYFDYSTGETTDPRVVSALIDYIREENSDTDIKIVESDASAMRTRYVFKMLGYEELANKKSVELVNLSAVETRKEKVRVGNYEFVFPLPRTIFDSDLLINVPKLKVGPYASGNCLHMTCALKNVFGCISKPRKVEFHKHLHEAIVGINKLVNPDLTVVDGAVALGKHPIKLGLIAAGKDRLAVDFVLARIMGYNPRKIKYLRLAAKEGIGDPQNISVAGESINGFRKVFPKRGRLVFKITWAMQLSLLRFYIKVTGDTVPSALEGI